MSDIGVVLKGYPVGDGTLGSGRMEWVCLDWNQPSIDFYLSLGAQPMSDWTLYRLTGDALAQLAE